MSRRDRIWDLLLRSGLINHEVLLTFSGFLLQSCSNSAEVTTFKRTKTVSKRMYRKLAMHAGQGVEKLLGELEGAIMDILWARGEASGRDVVDELNRSRSLAYTTVLTVMGRLVEKGLLTQHKVGRAHLYRPAMSREAYAAATAGQVIRSLVEDFGDIALAQFSQELDKLDPARLAALKTLMEEGSDD